MPSLPETSHQHHELIKVHVDRLPALAEMLGVAPLEDVDQAMTEECRFIRAQMLPHMEAIETALYGRLEQVMEGRHSMAPMRREHDLLRELFASLCGYHDLVLEERLGSADEIGLRRVLYRLYAVLKVHLAEEELYLGVLERNLDAAEKDDLARGIDHAAAEPL
jgi:hypothetical protein